MRNSHSAAALVGLLICMIPSASGQTTPEGFALVSDSEIDFSSLQGTHGWRYRFDRGVGTETQDMGFFIEGQIWCVTPNYGGVSNSTLYSHCMLGAASAHPNTTGGCQTPAQGLLRPIREWTTPIPLSARVRLVIETSPSSSGERFDLSVDGTVVFSWTWTPGETISTDVWLDVSINSTLTLLADPLATCGADGHTQIVRIYSVDCDANGTADALDIASGAADSNGDGVPDVCDPPFCPGDVTENGEVNAVDLAALLNAWGTNGSGEYSTDLDGDSVVSGADLAIVLHAWGPCPQ